MPSPVCGEYNCGFPTRGFPPHRIRAADRASCRAPGRSAPGASPPWCGNNRADWVWTCPPHRRSDRWCCRENREWQTRPAPPPESVLPSPPGCGFAFAFGLPSEVPFFPQSSHQSPPARGLKNIRKPHDPKIRTALTFFLFFTLSAAKEVVMFYQPVKLSVSSNTNATADRRAIEKTRLPRFDQGNGGMRTIMRFP